MSPPEQCPPGERPPPRPVDPGDSPQHQITFANIIAINRRIRNLHRRDRVVFQPPLFTPFPPVVRRGRGPPVLVHRADRGSTEIQQAIVHINLPRTYPSLLENNQEFSLPRFFREYDTGRIAHNGLPDHEEFMRCLHRAASFICNNLEHLHYNGCSSLFTHCRRHILSSLATRQHLGQVMEDIFWHVYFITCALDRDRGLGCSDRLSLSVTRFIVDILPQIQAHCPPAWKLDQLAFVAFTRVFNNERPDQLALLSIFWQSLSEDDQTGALRLSMRDHLPHTHGSNAWRLRVGLRRLRGVVSIPHVEGFEHSFSTLRPA